MFGLRVILIFILEYNLIYIYIFFCVIINLISINLFIKKMNGLTTVIEV